VLNPTGISHVFRNRDTTDINGWQDASGQFSSLSLPDVPTSAVALADFDPDVAYVGNDVGAFRTTDGGVTWGEFQDGLPRSPVVELRFHRRHNRLFAGTMGRGAYIRDVWPWRVTIEAFAILEEAFSDYLCAVAGQVSTDATWSTSSEFARDMGSK
jgi:hypothetical protein